jgi:hypothetical protein
VRACDSASRLEGDQATAGRAGRRYEQGGLKDLLRDGGRRGRPQEMSPPQRARIVPPACPEPAAESAAGEPEWAERTRERVCRLPLARLQNPSPDLFPEEHRRRPQFPPFLRQLVFRTRQNRDVKRHADGLEDG